jgi:hypothetical protein
MKKTIFISAALFLLMVINQSANAQSKSLTVKNSSGMIVTGVRISPADEFQWGFNLLVTGNLANNGSIKFNETVNPEKCLYDLSYKGNDDKEYFVKGVDLCTTASIELPVPEVGSETEENPEQ